MIFSDSVLAICQDCLRVIPTTYQKGMKEKCECGGEFCCCLNCQYAAVKLIQGEREPAVIGLQTDKEINLENWNQKTGVL